MTCHQPLFDQTRFMQSIKDRAIPNMTHGEMGLLLDMIDCYLYDLSQINVTFHTDQPFDHRCIFWVDGPDYTRALPILENMATMLCQRDPYQITTMNDARSLFGLPPIRKPFSLSRYLFSLRPFSFLRH